ncbi:hypothetical protein DF286_04240 [Sphingosinicella humi]|uniref:Sulfatase N-terminal domain-containing protein n=1 Tax=Allosphingosinicella humi TaxID=2068657 RepID=A0A2U2J1F1_9SPHN|nr:hypothetical protein DF286_04240 [Sphingosinicella humi]
MPLAGGAVALVVTLTLWLSNMSRVPYEDALPTVGAVLALVGLAVLALRLVAGGWARAGLMSGVAAVYILYLPVAVFAVSPSAWMRGGLLLMGGVAAVLAARRIPREAPGVLAVNRKINLILVPIVIGIAGVVLLRQIDLERHRPAPDQAFAAFDGEASATSPDVWHLIFDRYGNNATLGGAYGYDNSAFLSALRKRGFAVNEEAFSNYQRTGHSVASTLNASYLDRLSSSAQAADWVPIYRSLTSSQALRFFERQGYETVFAGSWWNPTRRSGLADRNINYRAVPELGRLVLGQSAIGFALAQTGLAYGDGRGDQCRRATYKFEQLRELADEGSRKYVFAHFLVPHPPFVLNADGSCRSLAKATASSRRDNYVAQIEYANREALRLIDAILAGPRPAVIVLHSDEGPWPEPFVGDERFLGRDPVAVDWAGLNARQLAEKMGILMAIRHVDGAPAPAPASPINVYPQIINAYFSGKGVEPAPRHYVFESDAALYRFKDVTRELN